MADSGSRPIVDAAARVASAGDHLGSLFGLRLLRILRKVERAVPDAMQAARDSGSAADAGAARRAIREEVRKAGFDALVNEAFAPDTLGELVRRVLALRKAGGFDAAFSDMDAVRLEAFGALMRIDLLQEGDVAARALWRSAVRSVFGGADTASMLDELAKVIDRTEPQIRTLYDTSVSVFSRQVSAMQAPEGDDTLFAFVGPVDAKTREWCLQHVGKVYTRKEIDALDNGQIGPVFLTGGGYNCRHIWMEVSRLSDLAHLHGTNGRIPEIQTDIERVQEIA